MFKVCQIHVWSSIVKISENTTNLNCISLYQNIVIANLQNLHAEKFDP